MRASRPAGAWPALVTALTLALAGCSTKNIVAVDPFPCADGDPAGCAPGLLDDLVGFWRLNDATGSATVRDWSGWRNDGALMGVDPATAWVAAGPEAGALALDGRGHVRVPPSASIDSIVNQVTLAAWVYVDGPIMEYATAISRQLGTGFLQPYHLAVNVQHQAILFITTPVSGQVVLGGPPTVPQQTWVHLAGTYDGTVARLYVDGAQVMSLPVSGPFAAETTPVIVGGNGNGPDQVVSELVPGRLADVMLYRRAISPDEIARIRSGALLAGR